jgi:hypothetical protein
MLDAADRPHAKSGAELPHPRPDVPRADNPQHLSGEEIALQFVLCPPALAQQAVRFAQIPGERKHERDRQFRHGLRTGTRNSEDLDSAPSDAIEIQVIEPTPGTNENPQVWSTFQNFGTEAHTASEHEGLAVSDELFQVFFLGVDGAHDIVSFAESGHGAFVN